ncbi:hypothetical protein JOM56_003463 [Amanita muscaria]
MSALKRSATSDTHHSTKKTRIVEPDDDPANFAEQVDSALELPSHRGKVKTEGYESDSSDDGEGVVYSRREKDGAVEGAEDEDDMFAAAAKAETGKNQANEVGNRKKDAYLRLGDIQGQEFGAASDKGGSSDESDEPEDEDDAERKKKAGMGYELSSFNMREEMEEGKFTEDGSYVRTFDPHGIHDRWMENLSEREIKLARKRKRQQERLEKQKMEAEEREIKESGGKGFLELQLLAMLKKGESILEALQRLGGQAKRSQKNTTSLRHRTTNSDAMNVDKSNKSPSDIERLTHLASTIMSLGDTDIYSMTYEELVRSVRSSGIVDSSWEPPSADVKYEYKWDVTAASGTEQIFGPFNEEEMKAWFKASYFGPAGEKVQVRQVGGGWGSWDDIVV